jgi:ribosomal protein S18 acetylase RimI-like enzyme
MAWILRKAQLTDYESLCALWAETQLVHVKALPDIFAETQGPERSCEAWRAMLDDPDAAVLVAEDDGRVVGYIQATVQDAPPLPIFVPRRFGKVNDLGVTAAHRRQGIGRALLRATEQWASARGATSIELSVWDLNTGARALYEALDYRPQSTRMSKPLGRKDAP